MVEIDSCAIVPSIKHIDSFEKFNYYRFNGISILSAIIMTHDSAYDYIRCALISNQPLAHDVADCVCILAPVPM